MKKRKNRNDWTDEGTNEWTLNPCTWFKGSISKLFMGHCTLMCGFCRMVIVEWNVSEWSILVINYFY